MRTAYFKLDRVRITSIGNENTKNLVNLKAIPAVEIKMKIKLNIDAVIGINSYYQHVFIR